MILSRTIRKARKEHHCCECRKNIPKGHTYQIDAVADLGRARTFKTCLTCAERLEHILGSLSDLGFDYDEGPEYGGMYQWYYEVHGRSYKD